jgi:hypothetical protein
LVVLRQVSQTQTPSTAVFNIDSDLQHRPWQPEEHTSDDESEDEILQSVSESEEVDLQEVVSVFVIYGS